MPQVTLTRRGVAWAVAAVLAFALPFGAAALRGGDAAPARATVLEPPALAKTSAPLSLRRVAALPSPPKVKKAKRRRTPRVTAVKPRPAATVAPVATVAPAPAPAAAPAPAPAPKPPTQSFDSTG